MPLLKKPFFWMFFFFLLFFLAMDFWQWEQSIQMGRGNFPNYFYYFLILQLCIPIAIYGMSKLIENPKS